ncbi:ATPase, type IV secretory pathway VirB11 component like protein [Aciduliprofundum sp. MAR08-339]|uniref:type II/IV secretion system ATPase subunit n=1 Tax=Aciduliprofundum sp. (strain MAR08-339) TaxID=673860 RepID=UPI0002A4BD7F|nr:ATPase, type IV secretory pathway VirB11 component like protein [Aciduliprofundum sp. MAR08-339]
MAMGTKVALAIKRNPHLGRYIERVRRELNETPEFYEQLSRDMKDLDWVNLIYPVGDPIFIHIYGRRGDRKYIVVQPEMSEEEKIKYYKVRELIFIKAGYEPPHKTKEEFERQIERLLKDSTVIVEEPVPFEEKKGFLSMFRKVKIPVTQEEYDKIEYYLKRDIIESGPLEPLLRDPYIEDIHAIGIEPVHLIHKVFETMETNVHFTSYDELDSYLRGMSERMGRPVSTGRPIVDGALPDGSRINIIYADDVSIKGASFTIRKFAAEPLSVTQLVKWGTFSAEIAAYLWMAIEFGKSLFISGETASGKTTTLNAIIPFIKYNYKVFTAEDTPEVHVPHEIWQRLLTREAGPKESRVEMFDLLKAALRSRPNYIIVGEIRGAEGNVAFQAMQTGHPVMATFHASSIKRMIQRLSSPPINVPVTFMDNLNIGVFQQAVYLKGRTLRRVLSVEEILGYSAELGGVMTKAVFVWDPLRDEHIFRGLNNSYILEEKIAPLLGYADPRKVYDDLFLRAKIIRKMIEHNIFRYRDVVKIIVDFQKYGVEKLPFTV